LPELPRRVHADELDVDEPLVRALLLEQFPQWAREPLERVEPDGTVNVIYRLGKGMAVRLPRRRGSEVEDDLEMRWLPFLAPHLPVEIPLPIARGRPGAGYPWYWSIHSWVEGEHPSAPVAVEELVELISALQRIGTADAPEPAYGRGLPLSARDGPVRDALERVDAPGALELWEEAMRAPEWEGERVWLHADIDARNVLARGGRLTGVIDWGGAGIGDPALDVMVAWKLIAREEREVFREALAVDDATWLRAQGWAVSQALIALGYYTLETNPALVREARRWLEEVLA
jgi:aminoglycoside phosphotransferase (APT) family kinase protein